MNGDDLRPNPKLYENLIGKNPGQIGARPATTAPTGP